MVDRDTDDSEALARERREAEASRREILPPGGARLEADLAEALDRVELVVPQVARGSLPVVAERLGRAYSRAMARMVEQERALVRAKTEESMSPIRAKHPCAAPGCPLLAPHGQSRCDGHRRAGYREYEQRRPDRTAVKRFYNSADWQAARAEALRRGGGRCTLCPAMATEVDHVRAVRDGGAPFAQENLRPLCRSCHASVTAKAHNFGRPR